MVVVVMMRQSLKNALLTATAAPLASTEPFAITRQPPRVEKGLTAILEGKIRLFKLAL
jgi:hypothetical protein